MIIQSEKLEWVDSTRGLAILLVFIYHWYLTIGSPFDPNGLAHWVFRNGNYGVQLFFVASAYTLMLSVDREFKRSKKVSWKKFYLRRFFRIAPAYYVAALFYPFWNSMMNSSSYKSGIEYFYVLTFTNGFVESVQNSIVPGSWSISAEFFFYMAFPLIWFLSSRAWHFVLAFIVLLPLSVLLPKLIGGIMHVEGVSSFSYYHVLRWPSVFFLGVIAYKWGVPMAREKQLNRYVLLLIFILAGVVHFILKDVFRMDYFWLSIMWSLLIVFLAISPELKGTKFIQFVGRLSFSGYLVHFWCLDFSKRLGVYIMGDDTGYYISAFVLILSGFLTLFFSYLSNKYIELPGQALGRLIIRRL